MIDIFNDVSNVLVEMPNGGSGAADNTFGIRGSSNVKVNINGGVISAVPGNRLAMYIKRQQRQCHRNQFCFWTDSGGKKRRSRLIAAGINVSGDASIHSITTLRFPHRADTVLWNPT